MNWKTQHSSDESPLYLHIDLMQLKKGRNATKTFPPGQDFKANGLLKIFKEQKVFMIHNIFIKQKYMGSN